MKKAYCFLITSFFLLSDVRNSIAEEPALNVLKQLSLNAKEVSRLLQGDIVSKKLRMSDKRDIALLGAMILDVPADATVQAAHNIKKFKEGNEILGLEKFQKFDADELKTLNMEDKEIAELGNCQIGDCESKMPDTWIERLSGEKDKDKRMNLLRKLLADYAKDFAVRGNKAIQESKNTSYPVAADKEFLSLLDQSPYIKELTPEFYEYLREYPGKQPPGTESFIYWSREKFGFKPVINLTHVIFYRWSQSGLSGYLIASRQVYADHYYDASLGLTILIDRPTVEGKAPGSYLIYINRSRIDMLGGFLSSLRRAITLSRVRSGLESHMQTMKQRVENKPDTRKSRQPNRSFASPRSSNVQ